MSTRLFYFLLLLVVVTLSTESIFQTACFGLRWKFDALIQVNWQDDLLFKTTLPLSYFSFGL